MGRIITFTSTNNAIKGESILIKNGLAVTVMPLPTEIRAGCGICLGVKDDDMISAMDILISAGIVGSESYAMKGQGTRLKDTAPSLPLKNCASGGCGAKIGPGELSSLLSKIPAFHDDRLIVGYDSSDDAAVYKIDDEKSLVSTVDFFSPMVEDARAFGRIAAANALSDIYAMGGRPLTALNIVCFPEALNIGTLGEILLGGSEKVAESGAVLAGGHSIYDSEPKYGLAVTGLVRNDRIIRNNTPNKGDKLILTKPLGVGIIMAAHRVQAASAEAIKKAVASMERLNRYAAEKMTGYAVSACTDITGFGLLAHLTEMAGGRVSFKLEYEAIPYIEEAYQYAGEYLLTAAGQRNRNFMEGKFDVSETPFPIQELLFDPQTSGGLLICVAEEQAGDLLASIKKDDQHAEIIGSVIEREKYIILF